MTFRQKQLIAVLGAAPAFVVVYVVGRHAPELFGNVAMPADDMASRLAFVARWLLLPGLALLAGVHVAARRGFIPDAIEGTRTPQSRSLEINLRYNTNTTEQLLLVAMAWPALAMTLPVDQLVLIPAAATLFVVGRALFWIGYTIHPLARAFGMTLTALPTLAAYGWLVWRWLS
jgi:hypothetical protein